MDQVNKDQLFTHVWTNRYRVLNRLIDNWLFDPVDEFTNINFNYTGRAAKALERLKEWTA